MSVAINIAFKNNLKQFCRHAIEQRMIAAREIMQHAQEAANSEEKSSAGDKYETSRATGHLQKDMHARQLAAYIKELADLHGINTAVTYQSVVAGSFVETTEDAFFIAAGLGKQVIENRAIWFISPRAPLAGILQNKRAGDGFNFKNGMLTITNIF